MSSGLEWDWLSTTVLTDLLLTPRPPGRAQEVLALAPGLILPWRNGDIFEGCRSLSCTAPSLLFFSLVKNAAIRS